MVVLAADCLVDTDVIVDLLRGYAPAQIWIASQHNPGISRSARLEIIEGALNKIFQKQAINLVNEFESVEMTLSDFAWAEQQLARLRLSHNVGAFDCLIAAPAHRLQLPLYTRNLKHFTPLLGNLAQQPY